MDTFSAWMGKLSDKWGGYFIFSNQEYTKPDHEVPHWPKGTTFKGLILLSLLHYGSWAEAAEDIGMMYYYKPEWSIFRLPINYTTFWDYEQHINDPTGFPVYLGKWFIEISDG